MIHCTSSSVEWTGYNLLRHFILSVPRSCISRHLRRHFCVLHCIMLWAFQEFSFNNIERSQLLFNLPFLHLWAGNRCSLRRTGMATRIRFVLVELGSTDQQDAIPTWLTPVLIAAIKTGPMPASTQTVRRVHAGRKINDDGHCSHLFIQHVTKALISSLVRWWNWRLCALFCGNLGKTYTFSGRLYTQTHTHGWQG